MLAAWEQRGLWGRGPRAGVQVAEPLSPTRHGPGCLLGRRTPRCGRSSCDEPSSLSLWDCRPRPGLDFLPGRVSAWACLPPWSRVSLLRACRAVWTLLLFTLWASGTVFIFKGNFMSVT